MREMVGDRLDMPVGEKWLARNDRLKASVDEAGEGSSEDGCQEYAIAVLHVALMPNHSESVFS